MTEIEKGVLENRITLVIKGDVNYKKVVLRYLHYVLSPNKCHHSQIFVFSKRLSGVQTHDNQREQGSDCIGDVIKSEISMSSIVPQTCEGVHYHDGVVHL